jgi:DNA-binding GntR family transcriptional regulator
MFIASPAHRGLEMDTTCPEGRPGFTSRQGQYLAFIHAYRRLHGRAPAETDIQRFFGVSPPSVHQMLLTLERAGLISRQPGVARSVTLAIDPQRLPELHSRFDQPVKTTYVDGWKVQRLSHRPHADGTDALAVRTITS